MKMNQSKTKSVKGNLSYLLFILVFLPLFNLSAQNYVGSGGEFFTNELGYSFATSQTWKTDRSSIPGYFSWSQTSSTSSYSGLDDLHNIDGYVKKYGKNAFVFPIGTGTEVRTLSIAEKSSGLVTDAYAAAWIVGNPSEKPDPTNSGDVHSTNSFSGAILGVSTEGQWDWQDLNGTGEGLVITVSIPAITATGVFNRASNLRLVGWNGSVWKALGTTGASGLTNNSTLSGTMIAGIQAIGIGAVCSAGINYPTIQ
jgi:hypothetical protein